MSSICSRAALNPFRFWNRTCFGSRQRSSRVLTYASTSGQGTVSAPSGPVAAARNASSALGSNSTPRLFLHLTLVSGAPSVDTPAPISMTWAAPGASIALPQAPEMLGSSALRARTGAGRAAKAPLPAVGRAPHTPETPPRRLKEITYPMNSPFTAANWRRLQ